MAIELQLPARHRWTRAEYERAVELGVFGPDDRLELIEGDIVNKMPQSSAHRTGILLVEEALRQAFPGGHVVQTQMPLALGEASEPEPDVAIVAGTVREHRGSHPTTAVLVVEVSDTTLAYDRGIKSQLYARAGIAEYWILNLQDRLLEIYRSPAPMAEQPLGYSYRSLVCLGAEETFSPLAAPAVCLRVSDLLP